MLRLERIAATIAESVRVSGAQASALPGDQFEAPLANRERDARLRVAFAA